MNSLPSSQSPRELIAGVPCDFLSHNELVTYITSCLAADDAPHASTSLSINPSPLHLVHIVTLNAEMVVTAQTNNVFKTAIEQAELVIPDGSGILWAREYAKHRHPRPDRGSTSTRTWIPAFALQFGGRAGMTMSLLFFLFSKVKPLTGVDSIFTICEELEKQHGTAYLLGGEEGDRKKTAEMFRKKYPKLTIIALNDETPSSSPLVRGRERRIPLLTKEGLGEVMKPAAIFVALGAPKQTLWIEEHRTQLEQSGVRIAIGVGGAFAMISGRLPRAPKLFQQLHMEWAWRLMLEPARMKRIWNAVVVFPRLISGYPH